MSVVWQADIFCNGPCGSGCKSSVGLDFIEQGETYWDTTKGAAAGAWEVAKANGGKCVGCLAEISTSARTALVDECGRDGDADLTFRQPTSAKPPIRRFCLNVFSNFFQ